MRLFTKFCIALVTLGSIAPSIPVASAQQGVWTVGEQPRVLPLDRFPQVGTDATKTYGGTPAYYANMPATIPTSGYQLSDFSASDSFVKHKTAEEGGHEAKFRTICGTPSHLGFDDPILFPGQPGKSHLHQFFGNTLTNAFSTYFSLRTSGRSNCGGDVFNRTAYWTPAMQTMLGGKTWVVKADQFIVYYNTTMADSKYTVSIPRDFAYIAGPDPMNGYIAPNIKLVNDANAAAIASGARMRYRVNGNGFAGFKCEYYNGANHGVTQYAPDQASVTQPYLADAQGRPTLDCNPTGIDPAGNVVTGHVIAVFNAPDCWDGVNGHGGPDGRGHVMNSVTAIDNVNGNQNNAVCPDKWFHIPALELTVYLPIKNAGEYVNWRWSSDKSTDLPGKTGHIDWFGAWDYDVMISWQHFCAATDGFLVPHECDYSTFAQGLRLLSDSPIPAAYPDPRGSNRKGIIIDNNHDWVKQGNLRLAPLPKGPYNHDSMMH